MANIPLVDQGFYGNGINCYKEGLKTVGVMFEYGEAYEFMGRHLMSLAAFSALTKSCLQLDLFYLTKNGKLHHQLVASPPLTKTTAARKSFVSKCNSRCLVR